MEYIFRMQGKQYQELKQLLGADSHVEQGCFILCNIGESSDRRILLAKEVIPLRGDDFQIQAPDFLSLSPVAMLRAARRAEAAGMAICMVHTHPMTNKGVDFSPADDVGNERTFEFFNRFLPNKFNSCLVFGRGLQSVSGRVYLDAHTWTRLNRVDVDGSHGTLSTTGDVFPHVSRNKFSRQAILLGEVGQEVLAGCRIAVIGLGGIGSISAATLAHAGVGELLLIDPDIIDKSNLPRVLGATVDDVLEKRTKVDIARRYISAVSPNCKVQVFAEKIEHPDVLKMLIGNDAIVCGTDNHQSRLYLNDICQRYYISLLDLGVEFVADDNGVLVNEVGKVNYVLPGTACLWCSGHINSEQLAAEALPKAERSRLVKEGYTRNIDIEQPSMMMFNQQVAGRGMQQLIGHLSGILDVKKDVYEQFAFFGIGGRSHHRVVRKKQNEECVFCASDSRYSGAGDSLQALIKNIA